MSTKRERYLKALRNEQVDKLVWAPNFDYWLGVNKAEGTLPAKFAGMSRNDIVRTIGGSIWARECGWRQVIDTCVKMRNFQEGELCVSEYETPLGSIRQATAATEGQHRSRAVIEHYVKDIETLKIMLFVVEATHYEADDEPTKRLLSDTGDDGIVLNNGFCVPFIQFAKSDVGYVNAFYMWTDYRKEVDELLGAYFKNFLQGCRIVAEGSADVIATGDNMDGCMISPDIFREYAIPFYQESKKICAAKGKIYEGHWCGRTQTLLPLVPGCGLDVVEAIVTKPMADITLDEALKMLGGEVVLQGGIPSVLVCKEGGTRDDFEHYVRDVVLPLKGRRGFILGMSDNVPPNADFARIETVAEIIR